MKNTRLYRHFQPKHYTLDINLEREKRTFDGTISISGIASGAEIVLHAHKLNISSAAIDGKPATFSTSSDDALTIAQEGLASGEHTVEVVFDGTITNPMHGVYPCYFKLDGKDEELLATQFESHHAREAFQR